MKKTIARPKTPSTPKAPSTRSRFRIERRAGSTRTANWQPLSRPGFHIVGRNERQAPESLYEKQLILPELNNVAPRDHAWAVAKYSCDLMAEHALFFTLLMPPEVAREERLEAIAFNQTFEKIVQRLDARGPPEAGEVRGFVNDIKAEFQPFIDYKAGNHQAQSSGALRSLVWPSFFDHTRREAEYWVERLDDIGSGHVSLDRGATVAFWGPAMDEHFRFFAHLLDIDEHALIKKAYQNSASFQALRGVKNGTATLLGQPKSGPTGEDPKVILAMANEVLEFKTDAVRQIEAAKIKTVISPVLADHCRREAALFVDELKRLDA